MSITGPVTLVLRQSFLTLSLGTLASLLPAQPSTTQVVPTATISGRVVAEDGRAVRARVIVQFAAPRGFPSGPPRQTLAAADGSFTLVHLPPGQYTLCAQVPATESQRPDAPFLDSCAWGVGSAPVQLAAGQQLTAFTLTAPKGTLLQVRVADPEQVLPVAFSSASTAAFDPRLQVIVKGPDHLVHRVPFVSSDALARTYQMVVPMNTALGLTVQSSVARVFDQTGSATQAELPVQAAAGAALNPVTFTLHR